MKLMIQNDAGATVFSVDTTKVDSAVGSVTADVKDALSKANAFVTSVAGVISSIKADIQSAVSRIETELGAHPAFTWAQTQLSNAVSHLEAFAKGIWAEPAAAPMSTAAPPPPAAPAAEAAVTAETAPVAPAAPSV